MGVNIPVKQFMAQVNLAKKLIFKVLLPDSSPLDHGTLGNLKRNTCHTPYLSLDDLKASINQEWAVMSVDSMVKGWASFLPQVQALVKAKGGHFKI